MRLTNWLLFSFIATASATAFAQDAGMADMGPTDMGLADMGPADMGPADMGLADMALADMGPADMGPVDAGMADMASTDMASPADVGGMDLGAIDAGSGVDGGVVDPDMPSTTDAGEDANTDGVFTFSGHVELQDTSDASGVKIALVDTAETYTGTDGGFTIGGLGAATYQLEISKPGYVAVEEDLTISSNTSRDYTLFVDAVAELSLDVTFEGESPAEVAFTATSPRGEVVQTLPVESGVATLTQELGVATWDLTLEADGFRPATYRFALDAGDAPQFVNVFMYRDANAEVTVDESCGCRIAGKSSSNAYPVVFALLALGGLIVRRRRA